MTDWRPLRHHGSNIAQVLCQWLSKPSAKCTNDQTRSLTALRAVLQNDIPQNPTNLVAALDGLFFEEGEGTARFADNNIPRTVRTVIRVHSFNELDDRYYRSRPEERRLRVVSTLIHEMCHAFLLVYGCDGQQCTTRDAVARGRAFTGHGPAWEAVAKKAESMFVRRVVPLLPDVEYDEDEPLEI